MKRITAVLLVFVSIFALFAQAATEGRTDPTDLIVFAAASMTETMTTIKGLYEALNPNVNIIYNFDSSGTLKTQIENGADCDIFISAAVKQMNALSDLGLVDMDTRVDLLENRTTLAVPAGNPKGITGFDQLAELLEQGNVFLAIGNSDVPVGQYTQKIFAYYGIDEAAIAKCLTYGSNVKEVTTQVGAASVDCAIVYATDAKSAGLEIVGEATQNMCGLVVYPAAVMTRSKKADAAKAFLDYLKSEEAMAVFQSVGFSTM